MKKLIPILISLILILSALAPVSADGPYTTTVTASNPEGFELSVPASISFTRGNYSGTGTLKMENVNIEANNVYRVSVASSATGGFKMTKIGGSNTMSYNISSSQTGALDSENCVVADFRNDSEVTLTFSVESSTFLGNIGEYSDTLTYTVTKAYSPA